MSSARNINGLTEKQQVFCDLYRASEDPDVRGNAKRCYMIAYGATAKSAEANGPRLLKDKHVAEYLKTKTTLTMDKFDLSEERIIQEVACIAFFDKADLFDENKKMLHVSDMPEHARRALSSVEVAEIGDDDKVIGLTTKVKQSEKKPALELIMKYKGMLKEKVEHSGSVGGVLLVPSEVDAAEWQKQHFPQLNQT